MADEKYQIDFTISDESVNRYGYRILTEGIDTSKFEANPVGYFNHNTAVPAIGKWLKLWKDDGQLKGTFEFDGKDEFSMTLYHKYKNDYMRAVSLHVLPVEESDDEKLLLPGQRYATVTKSQLLEVSLVTLPGNANAVKLSSAAGNDYKPKLILKMDKDEKTVEQLKSELEAQRKQNAENLVLRHKERGVVQDGEVDSLKELACGNYETVSKMLEGRKPVETKSEDSSETKAKALVALHVGRGVIAQTEVAFYENAAKFDYEGTKKQLEARQGMAEVQEFVNGMNVGGEQKQPTNERAGWGYYEYFKNDPAALSFMEKNEPEKYKKLIADFEAESAKLGINCKVAP
ncbi:MAG: HK97 family phage prohead protease [Prolixibacteraceae bacterium]|nr:HK97 family phage prohead protease [Prolixibacteraceae bacterium]